MILLPISTICIKIIIMITSFFAPKTRKKRAAPEDEGNAGRTKRRDERVVTPPSQDGTSRRPLCDEATALLSLLCEEVVVEEEEGRAHVPDWRSALGVHFASSSFSSLAKFVARERSAFFFFFFFFRHVCHVRTCSVVSLSHRISSRARRRLGPRTPSTLRHDPYSRP